MRLQIGNVLLIPPLQRRFDFVQRRLKFCPHRLIGPFLNQLGSEQQRADFSLREHDRGQVIAFQKITNTGFGTDGYTRFFQRPDVAVHGPQAYIKAIGQFLRPDNPFGLQVNQDGG